MKWFERVLPGFRFRQALFFIGVVTLIGSLVGARVLTAGPDTGVTKSQPAKSPGKLVGPVVLGTVDSKHQPIPYGLPPVLQSGTIAKVCVKDGDEIHAGDALYIFDTSPLQSSLKVAESAVDVAKAKRKEAEEGRVIHEDKIKNAEVAVNLADNIVNSQAKAYNMIKTALEEYWQKEFKGQNLTEAMLSAKVKDKLDNDNQLFQAYLSWDKAQGDLKIKKRELESLKTARSVAEIQITQAAAVVKQAEAEVAKAQNAIDLCTIKAKLEGTIEQVTISEGSTLGIGTMKPALWLIPAGPRVIRAEIEADFAHKVTNNIIGKEVTIYDNTDPTITYKGKVRRIGGTFLAKRSGNDALLGSDTRVLEAEVDVIDAAPANEPPLRVGQRVRVDLGQ